MGHDPHLGRGVCARWREGISAAKEGESLPLGEFAFVRAVEQDTDDMRGAIRAMLLEHKYFAPPPHKLGTLIRRSQWKVIILRWKRRLFGY